MRVVKDDFDTWVQDASVARSDLILWPEHIRDLAAQFLAERAEREKNPGVWDDAPEWADHCVIRWERDSVVTPKWSQFREYTRMLPKTKAREIAERIACDAAINPDFVRMEKSRLANIIESAINEALGGGK